MKSNLPQALALSVIFSLGFAGCSHKTDANSELEKASQAMEKADASQPAPLPVQPSPTAQTPRPMAAPETQAAPPQQLNQAIAVYKGGNYEDAVARLQKLRSQSGRTPDQQMALQEAMAAVMTELYDLAARGDARAKAAIKKYEQMQNARQ